MRPWILSIALAVGCSGNTTQTITTQGDGDDDEVDTTCPEIVHEPIDGSQPADNDVLIDAVVTDEGSGVFIVSVWYKQETSTGWEDFPLTRQGEDSYTGKIPGSDVGSGGMDYFIEAIDLEENTCTMPAEGEEDPYHFRVSVM